MIKYIMKITVLWIVIFCELLICNTVFATNEVEEKTIEDGIYIIKSALNEKYVLDIYNNSKQNGANLELWTNNKTSNQKFTVKYLGNGCYSISPLHSNQSIDVEGNSKKAGTNVLQWEKNNQDNQKWIIKDAGNGYYNVISKSNGLYLDIPESKSYNGANVQVWTANGAKNQMFKFEKQNENTNINIPTGSKTVEDGTYTIKTALNEKYVLDIFNSSKDNGANLELFTNHLSNNQKFDVKYLGNGCYSIFSTFSDKSIDVEGNSKKAGANVLQWESNNQDNQQWIIKDAGNGYYNIISKSNGLYLDIPESKSYDGANVQVWTANGAKNQMFKFEKQTFTTGGTKTVEDGIYSIQTVTNNKVLDVAESSMKNNGNIGVWDNYSTANQKFAVKYIGKGYYELVAVHSGKYLSIENASTKSGANVVQGEYSNQDNQQWIIKDAGNGYYNIISKSSGMYLTVSSGNICVMNADNSNNQKFKFEVPTPLKGSQTIANGTYIIASALNKEYVFDIPESSNKDGEILELWGNNLSTNQRFKVTHIGDGYYTIKAEHSGKAMEVANGSMQLNTKVQQKTANSSDVQKWIIKDAGDGYYYIISKYSELYMEVTNGNATNGTKIQLGNANYSNSQKFKFCDPNSFIKYSTGTYGKSGLKIKGDQNGSDLRYYQYGSGPNVFFATFCVHGFEDSWPNDGSELVQIAESFWERLKASNDYSIANKWTIYIFPEVNPDGKRYGWTNNGPGRTTLYSAAPSNKGIDLNRCWSSNFVYQSSNRNYTGTEPFQAYEARYLRDFLLSHKSKDGQTVLVDLHGWTQQLIGDEGIRNYYRQQFPENTDTASYGKGYLINWARNNLGSSTRTAKSALIELPSYIRNSQDVKNYNLKDRYINATLSMLKGMN